MKRAFALVGSTVLLLTACGGVDEDDHYESADELVEAYESEGGACNEPQTVYEFDDHGDAVECRSGVRIYAWDDAPRREADVAPELQDVLLMNADEDRLHVAHQTWAFSVEGEQSAEWINERFGGRIFEADAHEAYAPPELEEAIEEEAEATEEADAEEEANLEADEAESDLDDVGAVGDTVTNYGAEMTLHDAYTADEIPWNDSGQRPGNPLYEIAPRPADEGAKWFVLETTIDNAGSTSMDLTCSWPIDAVGVDMEEREFDTIRSLHQYEDNPPCNERLQPGFSAEMTYVFSVPEDAEMIGMAFRDTEEAGWGEYSAFIFDAPID